MNISKSRYDKSHAWTITKNGKKIGTLYSDGKTPLVDIRTRYHPLTMDDLVEIKQLSEKEFNTIKNYELW